MYDLYAPMLFGHISKIISNAALAESLLQESFIKFAQSQEINEAGSPRHLLQLIKICNQLLLNHENAANICSHYRCLSTAPYDQLSIA